MTRIFDDSGLSSPVSVVLVEPNYITQLKTLASDGYSAIQVTTGFRKLSRITKPLAGHYAKAQVQPGRGLWEFQVTEEELDELISKKELTNQSDCVGVSYGCEILNLEQKVDVIGITKGKAFAGTVKRHNFATQDATHGNSRSHRVPGSIGQNQTPGRVFKGKKMAGQLGNTRCTITNLQIVKIDTNRNLVMVKGAIPGAPGRYVIIKPTVKAVGRVRN
jgi:large subunit ribosomal protein L3